MKTKPQSAGKPRLSAFQLPCVCANLRKAAQTATRFYDDALRPSGLRTTQFTLLQALNLAPGIPQKKLAELLGIDSTTLTRTLVFLRRKEWLRTEAGMDRRELRLFLTEAGLEEYRRALPYWQSAQKRLRRAVGEENWNQLMNSAVNLSGIVSKL